MIFVAIAVLRYLEDHPRILPLFCRSQWNRAADVHRTDGCRRAALCVAVTQGRMRGLVSRQESLCAAGVVEGWCEGYPVPFHQDLMKGDGIPLTPASCPLLPRKDLFAGLLA